MVISRFFLTIFYQFSNVFFFTLNFNAELAPSFAFLFVARCVIGFGGEATAFGSVSVFFFKKKC